MPRTTRSTSASAWRTSAAIVALIVLAGGRTARADGPALDCPSASEEGQRLRDKNRWLEAREMFRACSVDKCPKVVRRDCSKWLAELDESQPSIVVAAQDASGADMQGVRVQADGRTIASRLDGSPIPVDPGEHTFTFEAEGHRTVTQTIVMRVSEKNRLVRVTLASTSEPAKPEPAKPAEPVNASGGGGAPVLAYVVGGVGVLALGSFAYFGLTSKKDLSDLRSTCAPYCGEAQLDDVKSKMLVADVSLGVGIVALGVATLLFLTHGSGSAEGSRRAALSVPAGAR